MVSKRPTTIMTPIIIKEKKEICDESPSKTPSNICS
jgi:hypothetical protein